MEYIAAQVGCSLNWFTISSNRKCTTKEELQKTQGLFEWIQMSNWGNITSVTGCFMKCKKSKYSLTVLSDEKINWENEWVSEVYIQSGSNKREEIVEYLSYDLGDIIGDLGGYLGLFLGWSLLSMTNYVQHLFRKIFSNTNCCEKSNNLDPELENVDVVKEVNMEMGHGAIHK